MEAVAEERAPPGFLPSPGAGGAGEGGPEAPHMPTQAHTGTEEGQRGGGGGSEGPPHTSPHGNDRSPLRNCPPVDAVEAADASRALPGVGGEDADGPALLQGGRESASQGADDLLPHVGGGGSDLPHVGSGSGARLLQPVGSARGVGLLGASPLAPHVGGGEEYDEDLLREVVRDDASTVSGVSVSSLPLPAPELPSEYLAAIQELQGAELPAFTDALHRAISDSEIMVGVIPEEQLRAEEARIVEARERAEAAEAALYAKREEALATQESASVDRVMQEEARATQRLRRRKQLVADAAVARETSIHRVFQRAEAHLKATLKQQEGVVQERYGDFEEGRAGARRLKVEWSRLPQPVALQIRRVRAVKDKLPRGRYVFLASLFSRLGGLPMRWTKTFDKPMSTAAVHHRGRFHDSELVVNQPVHVLCPSAARLRPSHIIILQLFQLGTKRSPVDKVVGWTALPACDGEFGVVSGKFKLPILRGPVNHDVSLFSTLEALYAKDLDSWLGNVYVDVEHVSKECLDPSGALVREYDVEVAFASELLKTKGPSRGGGNRRGSDYDSDDSDEWATDGEDEDHKAGSVAIARAVSPRRAAPSHGGLGRVGLAPLDTNVPSTRAMKSSKALTRWWEGDSPRKKSLSTASKLLPHPYTERARPNGQFWRDDKPLGVTKVQLPVSKATPTDVPADVLEGYSYAVARPHTTGLKARHLKPTVRKLLFVKHELLADLQLGNVTSLAFWVQLCLLLLALYLRIYVHYLGQWMYLRALRVPVFDFRPTPYSAVLKYVAESLPTEYEIGAVVMGHLSVILVFGVFILLSWASQRLAGHYPVQLSQFTAYFGVGACLDGLLVLSVDLCAGNYNCDEDAVCAEDIAANDCTCSEGDAFKLYNRFLATEGSGVIGIVLVVFIMAVLFLVAGLALYAFLIVLHLDGRLLDLYRRLNAPGTSFFVPNDLEVSPLELTTVCERAQRWTGPTGTKRKIAVCEYVLSDPLDPNFNETTTHVVIYHASVDGTRELYRHFLRLPDGTIIELFGDMQQQFGVSKGALQDLLANQGNNSAVKELFPGM